ncbi:MAG: hypothetical protein PUB52_02075 [Lachnospiraceae bacterium]|nr:hypothetical protein [Lachnospiraceae bacterium]
MGIEEKVIENKDVAFSEKFLFGKERRNIEEAECAKERLEELGIRTEGLEKFHRRFLMEMPKHIEKVYEEYPEIVGYITSIKSANLPEGVLARTGPYLNKEGEYAGAEIQFSKSFFGKGNYEFKIVDLESDLNWRGERWLAGEGTRGVITHEMAHAMALKINAEDAGILIGERDDTRYEGLTKLYERNSRIIHLCYNALESTEISPRNVGREVSTYASGDFGEMFAECISRYETCKKPGRLSTEVHDQYVKLVEERNKRVAS